MAASRRKLLPFATALLASLAIGAGWWIHRQADQDAFSRLRYDDVAGPGEASGRAARVDAVAGKVELRASGSPEWTPLQPGSGLPMGAWIRSFAGGKATLVTEGGWIVQIADESEALLKGVRRDTRDPPGKAHALLVDLARGRLISRPGHPGGDMLLEVSTRAVRVRARGGELGIEVDESGRGRTWLMGGQGEVLSPEGARRQLALKQVERL